MQIYDMSAILGVKPLDLAEIESLNEQIVTKARELCELLSDLHGVHLGDGLSISVLRNQDTNELLSVHVTPVDATPEGDGILRYDSMSNVAEG